MPEPQHLADQIHHAYHDGGWIEVSPRDLFRSLTAAEAAAHPIIGAHSAWEIALHLAFWHDAVHRRVEGQTVEYAPEEDWPAQAEMTEANWQAALKELDRSLDALAKAVRDMNPERLDETVPARTFTFRTMLYGVMQHDLYHSGQEMMLRKLLHGLAGANPSGSGTTPTMG